jgi:DNA-binding NtrC family response regulator
MKSATSRGSVQTPVAVRRSIESAGGAAAVVVPATGVNLEALECALIEFALQQTAGNRSRAARFLRLSRSALLYRMHKYGLSVPARRVVDSNDGTMGT